MKSDREGVCKTNTPSCIAPILGIPPEGFFQKAFHIDILEGVSIDPFDGVITAIDILLQSAMKLVLYFAILEGELKQLSKKSS